MNGDLNRLLELMPPPKSPIDSSGDWQVVDAALGTQLPNDFKNYIEHYGTGRIAGLLWPLNPFSRNANVNLVPQSAVILRNERLLRDEYPKYSPWPLFPEPGGLFPWCVTDNGDYIFWRTRGKPDAWTIFIYEIRGTHCQDVPHGVAGFLTRWLEGDIDVKIFVREPVFEQIPTY